jgi:DNA gyrase/topoisomerase IV, subunit A
MLTGCLHLFSAPSTQLTITGKLLFHQRVRKFILLLIIRSDVLSHVFSYITVVGMAQDFVGSNNINLLEPSGQFGTRLTGGEDAASPRYIFTSLSRVARFIFPEADDILLDYMEDDGQTIEPQFYCPVIPLILVNGAQGMLHRISSSWSSHVST